MRAFTVCVALVLLPACTEVTTSDSRSTVDSAPADSVQAPPEETQDASLPLVDVVGPVDAVGADTTARYEAALQDVSPASEDAGGYPPPEHCDMDASAEASVTACPPPLSVCADGQRLKYFDWGQCMAGWCNWPETIMSCGFPGCSNGACLSGPTM